MGIDPEGNSEFHAKAQKEDAKTQRRPMEIDPEGKAEFHPGAPGQTGNAETSKKSDKN
jgi:hypothetical protein